MATFQNIKSFADIQIQEHGVPAQEFLAASDGFIKLFDLLGHGVFTFIQADIRKNITGLRTRLNKHNDPTLEAILESPDKHAIASVVLLIRGYRYVCRALMLMQQRPELDLYTCFKRTYDEVLAQHHSAVIRGLVSVALRAAPSRPDFYGRLSQGGDIEEFDVELGKWLGGLERIVTHIDRLLPYF